MILAHGVAAAVAIDSDLAWPGAAPLPLEDAVAALLPEERGHADSLTQVRRRDFAAGRLALRAALTTAGLAADAPILADDRGAPRLADAVGSISHKRGLAVALAAPARAGERIGVDVEIRSPPRLDLAPRILTEAERAAIADLTGEARGLAVTLRFSLKEAIYKAVDPFLRRYVGFREVAVFPEDGVARVESKLGLAIEAAWIEIGDLLVCTARATKT